MSAICLLLRWRAFPDQRELSSHAWKQSPDDTSDTQEERYRCAGLWLQRKPNRPAEHKLQNTGSPVGSLLGDGSKKAQNQDQGGKRCNGADQADGIDFKPMPLPAIIRVFSASDLNAPP